MFCGMSLQLCRCAYPASKYKLGKKKDLCMPAYTDCASYQRIAIHIVSIPREMRQTA